jgi:cytidylate kinase
VFETAFSGAAQRRGCEHFDQVTRQHNHSRSNPSFILGIRKNPRSYLRRSCRDPEVSRSTVPVANHPDIRAILVQQQRAMAHACR